MIPKDPIMLLSYINTQLRDFYPSFNELCVSMDLEEGSLTEVLEKAGYYYNKEQNQFI